MLTLGTSAGASMAVVSGTHTISAPIVLAGSLAVNIWAEARWTSPAASARSRGGSAALTLSGNGELILSGTDSYSGGTTVGGGTLDVLDSAALPDGSALTVGSGATLIFGEQPAAATRFCRRALPPCRNRGCWRCWPPGGVPCFSTASGVRHLECGELAAAFQRTRGSVMTQTRLQKWGGL